MKLGRPKRSGPLSTQVQLSIPRPWVLKIDQAAALESRTRSNFIALAAMKAAQARLDEATA